jgi:hypothetical protein
MLLPDMATSIAQVVNPHVQSNAEGSRPHLGALLLGYYSDDAKLVYAGRVARGCLLRFLPTCGLASIH